MSKKVQINLGSVDYDKLETEEDFRRKANELTPRAMQENGKVVAEEAWKSLRKGLGVPLSEKSKFVRETTKEYANNQKERKRVQSYIIELLKEEKAKLSK